MQNSVDAAPDSLLATWLTDAALRRSRFPWGYARNIAMDPSVSILIDHADPIVAIEATGHLPGRHLRDFAIPDMRQLYFSSQAQHWASRCAPTTAVHANEDGCGAIEQSNILFRKDMKWLRAVVDGQVGEVWVPGMIITRGPDQGIDVAKHRHHGLNNAYVTTHFFFTEPKAVDSHIDTA